jgi:thiamine biosynthesis lipoprotein
MRSHGRNVLVGLLATLASNASATTQVHYVMGTFLRVVVDDEVPPAVFDGCFARARSLDRTFSRFDPSSELARLNAAGGGSASDEFRDVLARAIILAEETGGSFDVTVGAVTALWRMPHAPDHASIVSARRTVGRIAVEGARVRFAPGMQLDFDGFVKGVAVDACVAALRAAGVTRALVSFGESSLYGLGAPRGAPAWWLDVRGPDPDVAVARLALLDRAAAVSAVFGGAGHPPFARAHVVDPRSARPLTDDVVSVVVAPGAADAEAWAKAVLVGGAAGIATAEAGGEIQAARLARDGVALGAAMRATRALRVLARARPLGGEVALR